MTSLRAFIRLSRLQFLTGGFLGVALGVAMARWTGAPLSWQIAGLVQVAITSLQLMTHYSNEYYDREGDALATRTQFSGGSGVLHSGALPPRIAINAAVLALFIALCALAALAGLGKLTACAIAVVIAVLAWSYSATPLRLHSRGAGELATALVVGALVPLFAYTALTGMFTAVAMFSVIPCACAMFVMMICVEVPDIAADGATGKRTLLVRYGRESAPLFISAASTLLALSALAAVFYAGAPRPFALLVAAGLIGGYTLRGMLSSQRAVPDNVLAAAGVAMFVATLGGAAAVYAFAL